jgi:hypothetical protein
LKNLKKRFFFVYILRYWNLTAMKKTIYSGNGYIVEPQGRCYLG